MKKRLVIVIIDLCIFFFTSKKYICTANNGDNVRVIKGTLELGTSQFNPENKYQINGTLTKHGENYLLEIKGIK